MVFLIFATNFVDFGSNLPSRYQLHYYSDRAVRRALSDDHKAVQTPRFYRQTRPGLGLGRVVIFRLCNGAALARLGPLRARRAGD